VNAVRHPAARELFARHAKREGRSIVRLRALVYGDSCVVETEVFANGASHAAGPYTFADAHQATAFVTEAVESLMYLGCDVYAE